MDAKAKARQLFEHVKAGRTVFTRARDCWMIIGPTADLRIGERVTVSKSNGSTTIVYPTNLNNANTKLGVEYAVWEFSRNDPAAVSQHPERQPVPGEDALDYQPRRRSGYRTVHSGAHGEGRIYYNNPGATQYKGSDGTFSVQIWDND
jgi:hypothetical protein